LAAADTIAALEADVDLEPEKLRFRLGKAEAKELPDGMVMPIIDVRFEGVGLVLPARLLPTVAGAGAGVGASAGESATVTVEVPDSSGAFSKVSDLISVATSRLAVLAAVEVDGRR
jgi:hypothetical protein